MLKAIIVDDELFIRKGLLIMIDWEKEGISVVGEASNGKQAIALMKEFNPDIVLVDIKMPVMDGLSFIEHIRRNMGSNAQIIILSGYADFKFAQKAMQYNVRKYILKPIDENELLEVLRSVKNEIEAQQSFEYKSQLSRQSRKAALIKGALLGKNSICMNGEDSGLFNIEKDTEYFCVVFHIKKKWYSSNKETDNQVQQQKSEMEIFIRAAKEINCYDLMDIFEYNNLLCFFAGCKALTGRNLTPAKLFGILCDVIKNDFAEHFQLFAGKTMHSFPSALKEAFNSAYETMKLGFYEYDRTLYQYADLEETPISASYNEEIFSDGILDAIVNSNTVEIRQEMNRVFDHLKETKMDPEVIKIRLNYLVHKIVEAISGIDGSYDRHFEKYLIYNVDYTEINIDELKGMVNTFCINAALYIQDLKGNLGSNTAYKVRMYVDAHFAEDITLTKLAQQFYINTVYLGQVFRKTYNMKFNDYLNLIRIEEAKKLLHLTNMKAYEISEKVGYSKPEYFSKKFEELTGLSPSEYRENSLKQIN